MSTSPPLRPDADAEQAPPAVAAIQAANPFVGLTWNQIIAGAARSAAAPGTHPTLLLSDVLQLASEQARVAAGVSKVAPDAGDRRFTDPACEQWLAQARRTSGSWWEDWAEWTIARSGPSRPSPEGVGDADHPVLEIAPGRYVRE